MDSRDRECGLLGRQPLQTRDLLLLRLSVNSVVRIDDYLCEDMFLVRPGIYLAGSILHSLEC